MEAIKSNTINKLHSSPLILTSWQLMDRLSHFHLKSISAGRKNKEAEGGNTNEEKTKCLFKKMQSKQETFEFIHSCTLLKT